MLVSTPWWILLPAITPAGIIAAALALQHLEKVLLSSRDAVVHAGFAADHPHGVHDDR
jgi:hypothetical protein